MNNLLHRNTIIERLVLPLSGIFTHSNFWSLARQMEQLEMRSREELSALQEKRLQKLLAVAANETDHWCSRLENVHREQKVSARLSSLAPTSKSELESGFPDQVVNRSANQQELRFAATRGTTQRMICVHDFAKRESNRAAMVRTLHSAGYRLGMPMVEIPPDICDIVCGEHGERDEGVVSHLWEMIRNGRWRGDPNTWRDLRGLIERNWIYNRKTYPPFGASGASPSQQQLDSYIDRLQIDRPYLVKGLTTYLYQIAKRLLQRTDVHLKIPIVKPLGSGATPFMRQTIEKAFGGRFRDDYGSAELGPIACDCEIGDGMHVFADLFIVEIVNLDGVPLPKGELGEVVVTDLVNHAMPLIRYRIGDLGRLIDTPCDCGRTMPRLKIEGRLQDAIRNTAGELVSSHAIADRLYREPWLDQFQLVDKRSGILELSITTVDGCEVMFPAVERIMAEIFGRERQIRVHSVRTIAAEPGGKFRWVKTQ